MDLCLAERQAEAFSAEYEDINLPPCTSFPHTAVFQTPNATLIHTSASAGESVPVGWCDRQESEPTEACFGIFDEPIQSAEVASLGEEAKESQVS